MFEEEMISLLVDDTDSREKSYVDFFVNIHRAIRQKISRVLKLFSISET